MTLSPTLNTWLGCPAKWNMYSEEGPRMNNTLEGWHGKVKKIADKELLMPKHLRLCNSEGTGFNRSRNQAVDGRRDKKEKSTTLKK